MQDTFQAMVASILSHSPSPPPLPLTSFPTKSLGMRLGVGLMKNCGAMAGVVQLPYLVSCQDTDVKCKKALHRNPRAMIVYS